MIKRNLGAHHRFGVAAAVAVLALAGGTAYAVSATVSATATDTVVTLSHNSSTLATAGTETPILTLALPASTSGTKYVIAAQGNAVNFGASDYLRCNVVVGSTHVSSVSAAVGDPGPSGSIGAAGLVVPFALTGGISVPASGGTAVLECTHDFNNGSAMYIDSGASMWAHKTTSLKLGTE